MTNLKFQEKIILIITSLTVVGFTLVSCSRANYEFLLYIAVIVIFIGLFLYSKRYITFPPMILWCLSLWSVLHMAGGLIEYTEGRVLYNLILIPLSNTYEILKYDQAVHAFGFFITTLIAYYLVRNKLKNPQSMSCGLGLVLFTAGCGFGALNEVIEFVATVITPETNVGGYTNTALDLVSNTVGSLFAVLVLKYYILKRK